MFANYTSSLSKHLAAADPDLGDTAATIKPHTKAAVKDASTNSTYDPSKLPKLIDLLAKYEENFTRHLKVLLDTLNYLAATETVVFLSLCARLSTANEGAGGMSNNILEGLGV